MVIVTPICYTMKPTDIYTSKPYFTGKELGISKYLIISHDSFSFISNDCSNNLYVTTSRSYHYEDMKTSYAEVVHAYVTKSWDDFCLYIDELLEIHAHDEIAYIMQREYEDYYADQDDD